MLKELKKIFREEEDIPSRCLARMTQFGLWPELSECWMGQGFPDSSLFQELNEAFLWYRSLKPDSRCDRITLYLLGLISCFRR